MASAIDDTKPEAVNPTTQSTRDNFTTAKSEITALQADLSSLEADLPDTSSTAKGDALLGVKKTTTGALATTQHVINENRVFDVVADGGLVDDGVTDISAALQTIATNNKRVHFPYVTTGVYLLDSQVDWVQTDVIEITADRGVRFDCTGATDQYGFWMSGIAIPGGGITALLDRTLRAGGVQLGANSDIGVNVLDIPSSLGLVAGSIIRISSSDLYNPLSSSSYRGELAEVFSVSGTTVTLTTGLADNYVGANTLIFKLDMPKVSISNIEFTRNDNNRGYVIWEARDIQVYNMRVTGARDACHNFFYIFGGEIHNCSAQDFWYSGTSSSYGLSIGSSQSVEIHGNYMFGGRHAFTEGGYEPSRYLKIHSNTFGVLTGQGAGAFDLHTDAQHCIITDNMIIGGAYYAGIDSVFSRNTVIQHPSTVINGNYGISANFKKDADYCVIEDNIVISYGDGTTTPGSGGYGFITILWQNTNTTCKNISIKGNKAKGLIGLSHGGIHVRPRLAADSGNKIEKLNIIDNDITVDSGSSNVSSAIQINDGGAAGSINTIIDELRILGGRYENHDGRCIEIEVDSASGFLDIDNIYLLYGTGCMFTVATNNFSDLRMRNNRIKRTSAGAGALDIFGHDTVEFTDNTIENMTATTYLDIRNSTEVVEGNNRLIGTTGVMSIAGRVVSSETASGEKTRTTYVSAIPTTLTWAVGDRAILSPPVVGQPKAWSCTVAGTPGTWISEGNL